MEFYNRGARVLEAWWMYFQEHRAQVIYSEKNFEFLHGKWRIKGTIDRVDRLPGGAVELIDYKMGFEDRNEWDVAGSLQLAIYALGLSRGLAQKVGSVGYFILTSLQKIAVPYDPSKEAATLEFISATAEKMLAQDMGRKGECARCAIRKFCPESSARD
jgi:RecB family exonuclease